MTYLILTLFFLAMAMGYWLGRSDREWHRRIREQMERWP